MPGRQSGDGLGERGLSSATSGDARAVRRGYGRALDGSLPALYTLCPDDSPGVDLGNADCRPRAAGMGCFAWTTVGGLSRRRGLPSAGSVALVMHQAPGAIVCEAPMAGGLWPDGSRVSSRVLSAPDRRGLCAKPGSRNGRHRRKRRCGSVWRGSHPRRRATTGRGSTSTQGRSGGRRAELGRPGVRPGPHRTRSNWRKHHERWR